MWHSTPDLLPTHAGAHPCVDAMASKEGMSADAFDLDNNFAGWSRTATIAWPDEGRAITLDAETPFDHMVVYAPASHPDVALRRAGEQRGGLGEPRCRPRDEGRRGA